MCLICIEFDRTKDLFDARFMLMNARREPGSIDPRHLDAVEAELKKAEAATKVQEVDNAVNGPFPEIQPETKE